MVAQVAPQVADTLAHSWSLQTVPFGYYPGVFLFGLLVGTAEIISRYRDEPVIALLRLDSLLYLAINAVMSVGVFIFLGANHATILPNVQTLWVAIIAGFGAMAILRSKILTFRTSSNEDVPIGVDAVITAFLEMLDRRIDRAQAARRWPLAYEYLKDVDDTRLQRLTAFLETNLKSYQNVSREELASFAAVMGQLRTAVDYPAFLRAISTGLALQAIVGSDNFEDVVAAFRRQEVLPEIKRGSRLPFGTLWPVPQPSSSAPVSPPPPGPGV